MQAAVAVAEIYKNHSSNINNNTRWEKSPRLGGPFPGQYEFESFFLYETS